MLWCATQTPSSGPHSPPATGVPAVENSQPYPFLGIALDQRKVLHLKLHFLPKGSLHPMTAWCWGQRPSPLPRYGTTLTGHLTSRTICGISWGFCCNCIAVQFLPLPGCAFPNSTRYWSQEHSPINLLHRNLCLRIHFWGLRQRGRCSLRVSPSVWNATGEHTLV